VWRHGIMALVTCVYLMCGSQLTLVHFKHDGSEGLMQSKLLILRERLKCYSRSTKNLALSRDQ